MKKLLALVLALAMVMSLAACGSSTTESAANTTPETPAATTSEGSAATTETSNGDATEASGCTVADGSDIVVLTSSDMVTFYPINAANTLDGGVQKLMSDGLVGFDKDYNLIYMLATGYTANDDATVYDITLREGVFFQDGTPWNAEAAKVNLDIMANQELGYKKNSNYKMIDTVEVVDEYTVRVNLKYPFGAFINYLAHPSAVMVSPTQIANDPDSLETAMIGTGQYSLKEWRPGESWTLELNRDWWGYDAEICGGEALVAPNAGFSSITFKPIAEAATRVAMLMNGEADFGGATSTYVDSLRGAGLNVEYASNGLIISYLYMNNQKEIFKDKRVRQAVNMAIDLDTLINVIEGGAALPADSYITSAVSYHAAQPAKEYNVEKAKALLAEAGYPNGFECTLWSQNSTSAVTRAEYIQQQLEQVGITVKVVPQESGVLSSEVSGYSGDPAQTGYDLYLRGFSPSTGDADQGLGRFSTEMFMPTGSNYCLYSSEEYDEQIKLGAETGDPAKREEAYAKAQEIIWEDCPAVCLFVTVDGFCSNPKTVSNVCWYPDGSHYFRDGVYVGQ